MNDTELEGYSRHILLNEFDIAGQEKLKRATVLIVGCGGLANACAPILASAGLDTSLCVMVTRLNQVICNAKQALQKLTSD